MVGGGVTLMFLGVAVIIVSFLLPTAKDGYYNNGLLQNQLNILLIGSVSFLAGMILMCSGFIKEAIEKQKELKN